MFVFMNNGSINIHRDILSSHTYVKVSLLGHMISAYLTFRELPIFSKVAVLPPIYERVPGAPFTFQ